MIILIINAGSSSIKYKIYDKDSLLLSGLIEGIGEKESRWHHHYQEKIVQTRSFADHEIAFAALAKQLTADLGTHAITAIGHRVVHGGDKLFKPTLITEEVLQIIESLIELAPIHNPINLAGIRCTQKHFPDTIQVAAFDSGFHHNMPTYVRRYAINTAVADRYQIRRYGFHGLNHEYVARQAAAYLNKPFEQCQFISLHLGNGASACLIKEGHSIDTSMGMTPLAGLVMGTRCGDIDPAIPLYLLEQGLSGKAIDTLLNKQSGLYGIAGENDMRHLLSRVENGDEKAQLAVKTYNYVIQKQIGAYLSQAPQLDALIFTGGVGENSAVIRRELLTPLSHFGFVLNPVLNEQQNGESCRLISTGDQKVLVIRGDEEKFIADQVKMLSY